MQWQTSAESRTRERRHWNTGAVSTMDKYFEGFVFLLVYAVLRLYSAGWTKTSWYDYWPKNLRYRYVQDCIWYEYNTRRCIQHCGRTLCHRKEKAGQKNPRCYGKCRWSWASRYRAARSWTLTKGHASSRYYVWYHRRCRKRFTIEKWIRRKWLSLFATTCPFYWNRRRTKELYTLHCTEKVKCGILEKRRTAEDGEVMHGMDQHYGGENTWDTRSTKQQATTRDGTKRGRTLVRPSCHSWLLKLVHTQKSQGGKAQQSGRCNHRRNVHRTDADRTYASSERDLGRDCDPGHVVTRNNCLTFGKRKSQGTGRQEPYNYGAVGKNCAVGLKRNGSCKKRSLSNEPSGPDIHRCWYSYVHQLELCCLGRRSGRWSIHVGQCARHGAGRHDSDQHYGDEREKKSRGRRKKNA